MSSVESTSLTASAESQSVGSTSWAHGCLLREVARHRLWSKTPAEGAIIASVKSLDAYHYQMKSWTEHRSEAPVCIPFRGGVVDSPLLGPRPLTWDIPLQQPQPFSQPTITVKAVVPRTEEVKLCHNCNGSRFLFCTSCAGTGRGGRCHHCNGTGRNQTSGADCGMCRGTGIHQCISCGGQGRNKCHVCDGAGEVLWRMELTAVWKTRENVVMTEGIRGQGEPFPSKKLRKAAGITVVDENGPRILAPIKAGQCNDLIASQAGRFVDEHAVGWQGERTLWQAQTLRKIPVAVVDWSFKEGNYSFYIYGTEERGHAPNYPKISCNCTML